MDPLEQVKLRSIMDCSQGSSEIVVGIVDGPVDLTHSAFKKSNILVRKNRIAACTSAGSPACIHGTFVAGILCASRGLPTPSICPGCKILICPIFSDDRPTRYEHDRLYPSSTTKDVSTAIIEAIKGGAKIINLSMGLSGTSLTTSYELQEAYNYAMDRKVIIVISAGNKGMISNVSLLDHPWVIPVGASNQNGRIDPISNFGPTIGRRGLLAPGVNIVSSVPQNSYSELSGTSFAAPFVTGSIALLWSLFPLATAGEVVRAIRNNTLNFQNSITPRLLDAEAAWNILAERVQQSRKRC